MDAASQETTLVPRWTSTPLASYHSWFCRSPPPPTDVWNPGRRAGPVSLRKAFVSAGRSYGRTSSALITVRSAPRPAATTARAK